MCFLSNFLLYGLFTFYTPSFSFYSNLLYGNLDQELSFGCTTYDNILFIRKNPLYMPVRVTHGLMASHMWHTDDIWDYEVLEVFFRVCLASSLCQTSPKNMWPNIAIYQSLITNNMTNYNCRRGPKLYMPNVWQWCKLTRRRLAWMAQINISPGSKISGAQGESKNWGLFYINNFFHPWYTYIFLLKKIIVY
jgi:hypothetical protein